MIETNKKTMDKTQSLRKVIGFMEVGDAVVVPRKIHTEQVVRMAATRANRKGSAQYQVSCAGLIDEVVITRVR